MSLEAYKEQVRKNNRIVKNKTVDECIRAVKDFYIEYAESLPRDTSSRELRRMILFPNAELCKKLEGLKDDGKHRKKP